MLFYPNTSLLHLQHDSRDEILKNFLLMVLLLDKTAADPKASKLPKGVPPLFNLQAPIKSSREVGVTTSKGRPAYGRGRLTADSTLIPPASGRQGVPDRTHEGGR